MLKKALCHTSPVKVCQPHYERVALLWPCLPTTLTPDNNRYLPCHSPTWRIVSYSGVPSGQSWLCTPEKTRHSSYSLQVRITVGIAAILCLSCRSSVQGRCQVHRRDIGYVREQLCTTDITI